MNLFLLLVLCRAVENTGIWHIRTMEYYSATIRAEILPSAVMWMEPEWVMLGEPSQSQEDKYHMAPSHVQLTGSQPVPGGYQRKRSVPFWRHLVSSTEISMHKQGTEYTEQREVLN